MNKDEILKRSREQNEDEGIAFINNKGMSYGLVGLISMFLILASIYLFVGGNNMNVPWSMIFAYMGAEHIGKYSASKKKQELVYGIIASLLACIFLMGYLLMDVLGVIGY